MPMIEIICYNNANYLANCSKNSAPYANVSIHNLAPYVTPNLSQINKNSARYLSANTHDSASRVTSNHSRINENSKYVHMQTIMIRLHMLLSNQGELMKI